MNVERPSCSNPACRGAKLVPIKALTRGALTSEERSALGYPWDGQCRWIEVLAECPLCGKRLAYMLPEPEVRPEERAVHKPRKASDL